MKRLLTSLLIVILFIGLLIPMVKADSGWDSSYSSSDSGSSYSSSDSDSSSDSSSYDLTPEEEFTVTVITVVTIIILVIIYTSLLAAAARKYDNKQKAYLENPMKEEEIKEIDSSLDKKEVIDYTYKLFVDVQESWMNFDYDRLRELLSDELFNSYKMQLETLSLQNGKNVMKDFEFVDGEIIKVKIEYDMEEVIVKLHIRMKDYVINTTNNKVTHGNENYTMDITYLITLERSTDEKENSCINCGAPITDAASQVCPFCDSVIVRGSKDFVMAKKENIGQTYK